MGGLVVTETVIVLGVEKSVLVLDLARVFSEPVVGTSWELEVHVCEDAGASDYKGAEELRGLFF